jgi:hypothetical protein
MDVKEQIRKLIVSIHAELSVRCVMEIIGNNENKYKPFRK